MNMITVTISIKASMEKVWALWTSPEHIAHWNNMDEHWHTPKVENDLQDGGRFFYRMETKDGSNGFDFSGQYDKVIAGERIEYTLADGRRTIIKFDKMGDETLITETFDPESKTPMEEQKMFCQSVLNNFKHYVENTDY